MRFRLDDRLFLVSMLAFIFLEFFTRFFGVCFFILNFSAMLHLFIEGLSLQNFKIFNFSL